MSYNEAWSGKFKILTTDVEEGVKIINEAGLKKGEDYELSIYNGAIDDIYIITEDTKFKFINVKIDGAHKFVLIERLEEISHDDEYHTYFTQNDDGTITFDAVFYNGGCCLYDIYEEIIEQTLRNPDD